MKSVNLFDMSIIVVYFVIIMGIGLFFMKVNKGGKEYFTGGSMIPWWMSGLSLYMGNFSAWIFTGAAGSAYTMGWITMLYFSVGPIAYLIGTSLTATKWRRTRSISPLEYTHSRFNVTTQQFMSFVIATNFTLSAGVQLASTCKLFAPIIGIPLVAIVLLIGTIVMLHNFFGGVWGDMAMDVVQGVILLGITFIVMPLSLGLIGGIGNLVSSLPPLSFDQTYNGVHYTEHWVLSILIISSLGFAAGGAQRFYSVKDEKSAKRVGRMAAILALSVPLVFGVPPLVARVYWPDLSQVEFFRPFADLNPQDLVFVGLVHKLLPHGLIGVFIAAMLAATMTTLSTVYNMVSSIISHDIYKNLFRPDLTDRGLLKVGRFTAFCLGLIVMVLAMIFVHSKFGIFNIMMAFFTLFNIPVTVPIAFGLIFRRVPKWGAIGSIVWGLLVGATTRYVLGWDIGPQVYLSFFMSAAIFVSSYWLGDLYKKHKLGLAAIGVGVTLATGALFMNTRAASAQEWMQAIFGPSAPFVSDTLVAAVALVLGLTVYRFGGLFASETEGERKSVNEFFKKLDTPVDVAREVYGAGRRQVSTLPLVGRTIMFMGILVSMAFFTEVSKSETIAVSAMSIVLFGFGLTMWLSGKRIEREEAALAASTAGSAD